jgi:hypothetical protein
MGAGEKGLGRPAGVVMSDENAVSKNGHGITRNYTDKNPTWLTSPSLQENFCVVPCVSVAKSVFEMALSNCEEK